MSATRAACLAAAVACVVAACVPEAHAATAFSHGWDKVADVMAMHGKWHETEPPPQASIEFVARNYATITTGTVCSSTVNLTHTIEEAVLSAAARIKAANPEVAVGMYWRSRFALEVGGCSGFAGEWAAHPEWRLLNDDGKPVRRKRKTYYFDFLQAPVRAFFAKVLVNVTRALLPSTGKPVLDFVYIDESPKQGAVFAPGVGAARSAQLGQAAYATFADIQNQLDAAGHGQKVILNSMDSPWAAAAHVATGAAATMFDHWSIIEFLNRSSPVGALNASAMDGAFAMVTGKTLSNVTTQIKGWPGPIVKQRDVYPKGLPGPSTPAQFQAVAGSRFNSELALFLLVASAHDYWVYSWFWDFDDYVPGQSDSTVPAAFFPQAQCALGAPLGAYQRVPGTWTYKRAFEHASVFVDLTNRTASKVTFNGCAHDRDA